MQKHAIKGSERLPLPGAKLVGPADPAERLEVTILLRRTASAALQDRVERITHGDFSLLPMTREAFAKNHGASTADIEAVRKFATANDLAVVAADAPRRSVVLSGTVARFNKAFGVDLQNYEHAEGTYRGRTGSVNLPGELRDIVQAVLGLDNRPQARAHFRRIGDGAAASKKATGAAAPVSYPPTAVAQLYGFPNGTGHGETIAIIELGGGYKTADLQTYFKSLKITPPKVVAVSVDHGKNQPTGSADGPDGEVMLDIEVAGAVAPQANIVVYFTPNTDAGFLDAITTAIHDTTHKPSIISISWGGPESSWTAQALTAFDEAFQAAVALGITVTVAAGDNGSTDGVTGSASHVDFPASSPHVLACGGTSLRGSASKISSETVWNDGSQGGATGGGISATFAVPSWQSGLSAALTAGRTTALTMRGMPDVAGDADPETGYAVRVDGSNTVIGGTSAVAPLWAGLVARLNGLRGSSIGFINPMLYAHPSALNDITSGNNGAFKAAPGWDACTGLGSPDGSALAALFASTSAKRAIATVNVGDKAFVLRDKKPVAEDNAVLIRGNAKPAGKVKKQAVLLHGNDEPAKAPAGGKPTGGKLKKKAVLIRGNDEHAGAEPAGGQPAGGQSAKPKKAAAKPDAVLIRGNSKAASGKAPGGKVKPDAVLIRGH